MDTIKWPAVIFSQGILEIYTDARPTSRCSMMALNSGWFDDMKIVDSAGNLFRVTQIITTPSLTKFNSFFFRLINKILTVELNYEFVAEVPLSELKQMVIEKIDSMEKNNNRWSEKGNVNVLKRKIMAACSLRMVMQALAFPRHIPEDLQKD